MHNIEAMDKDKWAKKKSYQQYGERKFFQSQPFNMRRGELSVIKFFKKFGFRLFFEVLL